MFINARLTKQNMSAWKACSICLLFITVPAVSIVEPCIVLFFVHAFTVIGFMI